MATNLSFSAAVERFTTKTKRDLRAVFQYGVQYTVDDLTLEGPSVADPGGGRGGRMPVRTGFLRASVQASETSPPVMLQGHRPPNPKARDAYQAGGEVGLVIAAADIGDVIYIGFTAEYSVYVEARYGFVEFAAANWQANIDRAIAEVKGRSA